MKVLVTHSIPEVGLNMLRERDISLDILDKDDLSKEELISKLEAGQYNGVLSFLTDVIDNEVIDAMGESVSIVANYAAGFNNIDVEYAKSKGIVVTNTPGVSSESVAEHTIALMLACSTRFVEADKFVREGKFNGWDPNLFLGLDLKNKLLGLLGAGNIGSRVGQLAKGIGMNVIYYDVVRSEKLEDEVGATRYDDPDYLLKDADVVSLHLPLNGSTHHFLNRDRLSLMKKDAILVNTARGGVIDEDALVEVLEGDRIFSAGLDVFEDEPIISDRMKSLSNVILTPHIASSSFATRERMAEVVADNIISVLFGGVSENVVG